MKPDSTVLSMFGVCVNFRKTPLQWPAVQLCGEMELGGETVKDSYFNLLWEATSVLPTRLSDNSSMPCLHT